MLVEGEGHGSKGMSSELDTGDLNRHGEDQNDEEQGIVEEVFEDVYLFRLELPGVDLVKDLHQHKCVEEDAVMFSTFHSPLLDSDRGLEAEQLGA